MYMYMHTCERYKCNMSCNNVYSIVNLNLMTLLHLFHVTCTKILYVYLIGQFAPSLLLCCLFSLFIFNLSVLAC